MHPPSFPPLTPNMIGAYGPWGAARIGLEPGALSLRHPDRRGSNLDRWRADARARVLQCMAPPADSGVPQTVTDARFVHDGVLIERLSWQLPYGPPTTGYLLKPADEQGPLPGILALHDHGGNKVFGSQKIVETGDDHPLMLEHRAGYYGGVAWANQLAKRGYVVLVPDAFAFGSRRVRLADVPLSLRQDPADPSHILDDDISSAEAIAAYNRWAGQHESILAKSLFCAGTSWAGLFLSEDQRALDVLCARPDVAADRVGCAGLSGGGLRTVYLGGLDPRIHCAVCVGMMTTWRDYLLNKSANHTWMVYIPHLPRELDYPEILGLRAPAPTLVLNDTEDSLFTLDEMQRADVILTEVFAAAGAPEAYRANFYPGPHKFDLAMQEDAFVWFDRWLAAS